jgi:hypothetical protein
MNSAVAARRARIVGSIFVAITAAFATADCSRSNGAGSDGPVQVKVLSNRANLISGGDALVEVVLPGAAKSDDIVARLGDIALPNLFKVSKTGRMIGLVTGLKEGQNELTVNTPYGQGKAQITNYPNGGPIFSGPQIQPWPCLEGATDAQCNRPVVYDYQYMPSDGGGFSAYDPANPPTDVGTVTTDSGKTVPYIIRRETGSQDRGQYQIAVLFDPSKEFTAANPQEGWNGKTYVTGGSGCGTHHGETEAPDVMVEEALKRGYMVWSTALDHNTQNCNLVVQAESLMMAKERIIEQYGPIRYTIGSGCSGGSIYQQQAANDYPGIFDGILPSCSFPDSWSTAIEVTDCRLLVDYFDAPSKWAPGVAWAENQQAAVAGHPGINICQSWVNVYAFDQGGNPRRYDGAALDLQSCNVENGTGTDKAYDPATNPEGVRCDLGSYFINELGTRPESRWGEIEKKLGRGFAQPPYDNFGVQYGLGALKDGSITPAQFVDLNAKIGGRSIDYDPVPERVEADVFGLNVAYRGGLINMGNNMHLPIIDLRGHDVAEIHHDYRSYVMRARLDRSNGHHDNQVIWTGAVALVGDTAFEANALSAMDKWLAAIEADTSAIPYAAKVAKNKPAEAHDLCTDGDGHEIESAEACAALNPYYAEPRMVAGAPFTGDVVKCQLKPLDPADYEGAVPPVTEAQIEQLKVIFPAGVCDYTKPGVGEQMTIPWMGYAGGPGGAPL